jgi:dephospho-CoA kinase
MGPTRPILRAGLTGGIASGKTTVGHILAELGAYVLDGDALAHEVMAPGTPSHEEIVARFGREILDGEGRIHRPTLARMVFHDAEARRALNAIVHPRVGAEAARRIDAYAPRGRAPIAVFDAALLVESGIYRDFHRLIVVSCGRETQIRRLLARDGLGTDEAEARIDSQAPLDDKLAVADYVIDTEGTLRQTRRQTERVYAALLADFESEFGPPHE